MSSIFPYVSVEDVASSENGAIAIGPFGSAMKSEIYVSEGTPVIRGTNIGSGRSISGEFVYISEEDASRLKRSALRAGDIFFPHRGAIGQVGIIASNWHHDPIMSSSIMRLRVDDKVACPEFVFWYFKSDLGRHEILTYASTVGTPGIGQPLTSLRSMRLPLPPLKTQREIASILNTLDDKIELNRRMSATLEEMARSLYRSWFVDFDPVHAKMEGRQPAFMDEATAALFPDRFGEDGLPEGWRLGKLSDLIDFNPTERISKGIEAPYLDMKTLPTSGMQHEPATQRSFTSGTKFRNGDTLLARITPCLENGKTALVQGLEGDAVGWGSTEFIVMRPAGDTALAYPYCVARSSDFRDEAIASMTGSSGRQRADAGRIKSVDAAIPPREIMTEFSSTTDPLIRKIAVLGSESQTLAALRDSLLPKLMSGELRVGDARNQIEEVA
jgi:type I restriction enzyme S subunit